MLAFAGDDDLRRARLVFFTWVRRVASVKTRVAAPNRSLSLTASVRTVRELGVLAFSRAMAALLAEMDSTLQSLVAFLAARDRLRPTWLVLQNLLAAHAFLLHEVWALRAALFVSMTIMWCLRMTTGLWPLTLMWAWRWLRATWLWWVENGASAVTGDLLKDSPSAASARSSVAKILATMSWITTLELASTSACADVLGLEVLSCSASRCLQLSPCRETCRGVLLALTTALAALMTSAIKYCTANAHALWSLLHALMAYRPRCSASTAAVNGDNLKTWIAVAFVTFHLALVSASQLLRAKLLAMRYWILARRPETAEVLERRLPTRAAIDQIRR